ncbi:class I SAM-dependent methyltransferase [Amycolatopsis minnesotensis]|uniref:Methyltransferase domain-containing protein n=1 Tax=Amycolatopsis minnesotensis TaxID=337894 RepID=A0ABP5DZU0_9PSEU
MNDRLARAWTDAADGYDAYFVPRFAPWVDDAVHAVHDLPDGPILVPCCGTFPELEGLSARFPGRELVGIDLSAGMVRLARERAAGRANVTVIEDDAASLDPQWTDNCAAVVSVFGLQQLPEPAAAIRCWFGALRPGGRLSVVYWPGLVEEDGPFARMAGLVRARVGASRRDWEEALVPALDGARIDRDDFPGHAMSHADATAFFDAYTRSGPLRALASAHGEAFVTDLRHEFLRDAPSGEWTHRPRARHLVATR